MGSFVRTALFPFRGPLRGPVARIRTAPLASAAPLLCV